MVAMVGKQNQLENRGRERIKGKENRPGKTDQKQARSDAPFPYVTTTKTR
jgi:hypothetical protein